jgi:Raf kinase inhibitor-like YbhB/YbcL family protein
MNTAMHRQILAAPSLLVLLLALCLGAQQTPPQTNTAEATPEEPGGGEEMPIKISSTAFGEGAMIPPQYTCDGKDVSPPFSWSGVPDNAKTLALIGDDPDAPRGTWVHWVLYNLPADVKELPENLPTTETLPSGALQGKNDFGRIGYGGPCPPSGTHRYYFKLYALDADLDLAAGATKDQLLKAMVGKVVGEGQLMGRYRR